MLNFEEVITLDHILESRGLLTAPLHCTSDEDELLRALLRMAAHFGRATALDLLVSVPEVVAEESEGCWGLDMVD